MASEHSYLSLRVIHAIRNARLSAEGWVDAQSGVPQPHLDEVSVNDVLMRLTEEVMTWRAVAQNMETANDAWKAAYTAFQEASLWPARRADDVAKLDVLKQEMVAAEARYSEAQEAFRVLLQNVPF